MKSGVMPGGDAPALNAVAVTPSDTVDLHCRMLYVGGTGDLTVVMQGSSVTTTTVVFQSIPAGTLLPIQVWRVMAASTASKIVALY